MAYDKHIWTCGEAITTEKLQHMEDGIAEGGGGAGYECTENVLTDETLTAVEA